MTPTLAVQTFDDYYRHDYRKLVGFAFVLTGSRWLAEDLVQEALTEAYRKWPTVAKYDNPAGWVRRVLVNKNISRGRRLHTETKGLKRIGSRRVEVAEPVEPSCEVWSAVRALPNRQAQAVALFYWEDCSVKEVADILGISRETAKTHLKRGRAALAEELDVRRARGHDPSHRAVAPVAG